MCVFGGRNSTPRPMFVWCHLTCPCRMALLVSGASAQDGRSKRVNFPSVRMRDLFLARLRAVWFEATTSKMGARAPFPVYVTPQFLGPTLNVACCTWNVGESDPPEPEIVRAHARVCVWLNTHGHNTR